MRLLAIVGVSTFAGSMFGIAVGQATNDEAMASLVAFISASIIAFILNS